MLLFNLILIFLYSCTYFFIRNSSAILRILFNNNYNIVVFLSIFTFAYAIAQIISGRLLNTNPKSLYTICSISTSISLLLFLLILKFNLHEYFLYFIAIILGISLSVASIGISFVSGFISPRFTGLLSAIFKLICAQCFWFANSDNFHYFIFISIIGLFISSLINLKTQFFLAKKEVNALKIVPPSSLLLLFGILSSAPYYFYSNNGLLKYNKYMITGFNIIAACVSIISDYINWKLISIILLICGSFGLIAFQTKFGAIAIGAANTCHLLPMIYFSRNKAGLSLGLYNCIVMVFSGAIIPIWIDIILKLIFKTYYKIQLINLNIMFIVFLLFGILIVSSYKES